MSSQQLIRIYCDSPNCLRNEEPFTMEPHPGTAADQRALAKKDGWGKDGKYDYCPACWKRVQEKKNKRKPISNKVIFE